MKAKDKDMTEILTILHEVADFTHWKAAYDADAVNRDSAGLTELMLVRQSTNPRNVALVFAVSDHEKAKAMVQSPVLHAVMKKAGIVEAPDIHFRQGEFTRHDASRYLSLNCRIRDIATFRKGYAMDKAEREKAGLTDLALLQNVDDGNDLLLVWAVEDVARATAFIESPQLAEHQVKNAGVVGPPQLRFWNK